MGFLQIASQNIRREQQKRLVYWMMCRGRGENPINKAIYGRELNVRNIVYYIEDLTLLTLPTQAVAFLPMALFTASVKRGTIFRASPTTP
jgi:hypothetical protein